MNDPHVAALKYKFELYDYYELHDPADLKIDTPEFGGRLSKGLLILEPRRHFATEAEVKPIADAFVQAWEIDSGLSYGRPWFRFCFEGCQVII